MLQRKVGFEKGKSSPISNLKEQNREGEKKVLISFGLRWFSDLWSLEDSNTR